MCAQAIRTMLCKSLFPTGIRLSVLDAVSIPSLPLSKGCANPMRPLGQLLPWKQPPHGTHMHPAVPVLRTVWTFLGLRICAEPGGFS